MRQQTIKYRIFLQHNGHCVEVGGFLYMSLWVSLYIKNYCV